MNFVEGLILVLLLLGGIASIAVVFHIHTLQIADDFLDHLLMQEQEIEDKIKAEVAKRFNT